MSRPGGFREWVVGHHAALVTGHPWKVVIAAVLLAVAAWPLVRDLPLKTTRLDLAPADDPSVIAYREFNRAFGALHTVFVIASGPAEQARAFLDAAAGALAARRDRVRSVIHRVDVSQLEAQQLHAAPVEELRRFDELLARSGSLVEGLAADPSLPRVLEKVVEELTDEEATVPSVAEGLLCARVLEAALSALEQVLRDGGGAAGKAVAERDQLLGERARRGLDDAGYLVSKDGQRRLMVVSPSFRVDDPETAAVLLAAIEEVVEPLRKRYSGVEVAYAGAPIQDIEEQATITRDMARTAALAYLAVLALSFLAFRNIFVAVRSNVVLALAVFYSLALAGALVGQLNIISSVFIAVLVGLGDDFGIYLFTLYRNYVPTHGRGAMAHAIRTGVPGLTTGAATVAAAFLALQLQQFRAFRELGLIAGVGVLVAFVCMVVVLPALIVLMQERFPLGVPCPAEPLDPAEPDAPLPAAPPEPGTFASLVVRHARPIVGVGGVLLGVAALAVPRVGFDYDLTQLQAASAGAVRAEATLRQEFGLSSEFVVVRSRTLAEARSAAERLRAEPAMGTVASAADFVVGSGSDATANVSVSEVRAVLASLAERARALPAASAPAAWPAPDAAACRAVLERLPKGLDQLRRLAGMGESPELKAAVARVERNREAALAALAAVAGRDPAEAARRIGSLTAPLVASAGRVRGLLERAAGVTPYALASLPPALRDRYVGQDGSLATFAWPARPLETPEAMRAFVEAAERVPGERAGLPIMVYRMLELIRAGLIRTALPALVVIVLMVLVDFRRLDHAALALMPMSAGTLATVGLMGWSGANWNPVNSIALSVMLGVGVDYGVNIVHRWRDRGDVATVLADSGRAILYAGATSVLGFGTLLLAEHRGLQSFGRTMALGTILEMVVALIILPALLALRTR